MEWIEEIPEGRFYLRVGLGRKASGSYYTPHSFVRFLIQETLGPQVEERFPKDDPKPGEILKLKVLDPAMGSGHFLVEACRFLGEALYEACRLCDEKATEAEQRAEGSRNKRERKKALRQADDFRRRVEDLPDPNDELVQYLPSRAPEGEETGLSHRKALALCRRLVAVHCLYGVDKNPLAVELAKLSLWIESHAEGMPLTFLDHRLIGGDSLTGPFFEHMLKYPGTQEPMEDLFTQGLQKQFTKALREALKHVRDLEASVGTTVADLEAKAAAKRKLDAALMPFRIVAAAWSGGVMLGGEQCDDPAYSRLVGCVADTGELSLDPEEEPKLAQMVLRGMGWQGSAESALSSSQALDWGTAIPALPYELAFPEVFFPDSTPEQRCGFDAVVGNPPWDTITMKRKEWFANYDFEVLTAGTTAEREALEEEVLSDPARRCSFDDYVEDFEQRKRANDALYDYQKVYIHGDLAGRFLDEFRVFMERNAEMLQTAGRTGVVVPSAFHANEGATGVRRLYLEGMRLNLCYSFENRRGLFEIHRSFKFAVVVASRDGPTDTFPCAFYLHDDEWLFGDRARRELSYTLDFVRRTGGEYLALPELRTQEGYSVCRLAYSRGVRAHDSIDSELVRVRLPCAAQRCVSCQPIHARGASCTRPPSGRVVTPGPPPHLQPLRLRSSLARAVGRRMAGAEAAVHLAGAGRRRRAVGGAGGHRRRGRRCLRAEPRPVRPRPVHVQPQELPQSPGALPGLLRRTQRDRSRSLHPQARPVLGHPAQREPAGAGD